MEVSPLELSRSGLDLVPRHWVLLDRPQELAELIARALKL